MNIDLFSRPLLPKSADSLVAHQTYTLTPAQRKWLAHEHGVAPSREITCIRLGTPDGPTADKLGDWQWEYGYPPVFVSRDTTAKLVKFVIDYDQLPENFFTPENETPTTTRRVSKASGLVDKLADANGGKVDLSLLGL